MPVTGIFAMMNAPDQPLASIAEIEENFALLDEWEDRYRYVIELGKTLQPLSEAEHSLENKVRGCTSQVWLVCEVTQKPLPAKRMPVSAEGMRHTQASAPCPDSIGTENTPGGADGPRLSFRGASDAHIVGGLIAILLAQYSGKSAREIAAFDPEPTFARLGLRDHLTPQRSNGLASMIERIRSDARKALQQAAAS